MIVKQSLVPLLIASAGLLSPITSTEVSLTGRVCIGTEAAIWSDTSARDRAQAMWEKIFIRAVRVVKVTTDDWGTRFTFDIVPAPGIDQDDRKRFSASASWEVIRFSDRSVSATSVSWILVIRPDLVEEITTAAAQGKKGVELMDYVNTLAFGTPGKAGHGRRPPARRP